MKELTLFSRKDTYYRIASEYETITYIKCKQLVLAMTTQDEVYDPTLSKLACKNYLGYLMCLLLNTRSYKSYGGRTFKAYHG